MWHAGFSANGCILGGVHAWARQIALFSVGRLNARSDFEASVTLLLSRADWFVWSVVTH
jgi:hypothetical protein